MTIFCGIDPGRLGAIALIKDTGEVISVDDLNSQYKFFASTLSIAPEPIIATVEDVCGRPGQSCTANTTFMKHAGKAELVAELISDEPVQLVKPIVWKKHFGLITRGLSKTEKKHLSIDLAKKLFPSVADDLILSKDGRAEALLIAEYGRQLWQKIL